MEFSSVETATGRVQGLISTGIRQFKGVPYGASTAGANRFQRPQAPKPWMGVRDCFGYAPVSPQVPYDAAHQYARLIQFDLNVAFGGMGEDCLHLNIWTPGTERGSKRAVLFCIHGGGFAICSGNHPMYDGAKLSQLGDVVVVAVTHRLSSFGYLNLHDLDPSGRWSDSSAAGMLDLVAALEWVRDNIENFGGDPNCVTIFGQSGGGWKVSTLLGMPAARGLFHRAVVQSGSLLTHMHRDTAAQMSRAFIAQLGLNPATLHRIQDLPWTQLLAAQTAVGAPAFAPSCDGVHIPSDPKDAQVASLSDNIPLIVSTTLDDAGLFFDRFSMTEPELESTLSASYGAKAAMLKKQYREHFPIKSPYLLHAQMITDSGFRRYAHAQSEAKAARGAAAVYAYLWEWICPPFDEQFGAAHAMDVAASMHNERDAILGSGSSEARRMCDSLAHSLLAFAKRGDPNNPHIPSWPRFDAAQRATLVFDRDTQIERDPYGALRKLWLDMPPAASVLG
ncbi:MAG TPA: carboxylesterase family protein [Steroidobacteraceae bacterium]